MIAYAFLSLLKDTFHFSLLSLQFFLQQTK
jgi:hypothetical protein